jgi:hypothetical protein
VVVRFADIGGIVDHHSLNFLFITYLICNVFHYNKNVDIILSAHDAFLEQPSSGTLKIERLESQIF